MPRPKPSPRRAAPRRRRLRREERYELLLDAAEALVVERGVGGLTMEGIAARGNVNKALPYQHFPNRDAVLVALHERRTRAFDERLAETMRDARGFADRIDVLLGLWLDELETHGPLLDALDHARTEDGALERRRRARLRTAFEFTAELIRAAYPVSKGDAALAAGVFLAGSQGLLAVARETGMSRPRLVRSFARMAEGAVAALARPRA